MSRSLRDRPQTWDDLLRWGLPAGFTAKELASLAGGNINAIDQLGPADINTAVDYLEREHGLATYYQGYRPHIASEHAKMRRWEVDQGITESDLPRYPSYESALQWVKSPAHRRERLVSGIHATHGAFEEERSKRSDLIYRYDGEHAIPERQMENSSWLPRVGNRIISSFDLLGRKAEKRIQMFGAHVGTELANRAAVTPTLLPGIFSRTPDRGVLLNTLIPLDPRFDKDGNVKDIFGELGASGQGFIHSGLGGRTERKVHRIVEDPARPIGGLVNPLTGNAWAEGDVIPAGTGFSWAPGLARQRNRTADVRFLGARMLTEERTDKATGKAYQQNTWYVTTSEEDTAASGVRVKTAGPFGKAVLNREDLSGWRYASNMPRAGQSVGAEAIMPGKDIMGGVYGMFQGALVSQGAVGRDAAAQQRLRGLMGNMLGADMEKQTRYGRLGYAPLRWFMRQLGASMVTVERPDFVMHQSQVANYQGNLVPGSLQPLAGRSDLYTGTLQYQAIQAPMLHYLLGTHPAKKRQFSVRDLRELNEAGNTDEGARRAYLRIMDQSQESRNIYASVLNAHLLNTSDEYKGPRNRAVINVGAAAPGVANKTNRVTVALGNALDEASRRAKAEAVKRGMGDDYVPGETEVAAHFFDVVGDTRYSVGKKGQTRSLGEEYLTINDLSSGKGVTIAPLANLARMMAEGEYAGERVDRYGMSVYNLARAALGYIPNEANLGQYIERAQKAQAEIGRSDETWHKARGAQVDESIMAASVLHASAALGTNEIYLPGLAKGQLISALGAPTTGPEDWSGKLKLMNIGDEEAKTRGLSGPAVSNPIVLALGRDEDGDLLRYLKAGLAEVKPDGTIVDKDTGEQVADPTKILEHAKKRLFSGASDPMKEVVGREMTGEAISGPRSGLNLLGAQGLQAAQSALEQYLTQKGTISEYNQGDLRQGVASGVTLRRRVGITYNNMLRGIQQAPDFARGAAWHLRNLVYGFAQRPERPPRWADVYNKLQSVTLSGNAFDDTMADRRGRPIEHLLTGRATLKSLYETAAQTVGQGVLMGDETRSALKRIEEPGISPEIAGAAWAPEGHAEKTAALTDVYRRYKAGQVKGEDLFNELTKVADINELATSVVGRSMGTQFVNRANTATQLTPAQRASVLSMDAGVSQATVDDLQRRWDIEEKTKRADKKEGVSLLERVAAAEYVDANAGRNGGPDFNPISLQRRSPQELAEARARAARDQAARATSAGGAPPPTTPPGTAVAAGPDDFERAFQARSRVFHPSEIGKSTVDVLGNIVGEVMDPNGTVNKTHTPWVENAPLGLGEVRSSSRFFPADVAQQEAEIVKSRGELVNTRDVSEQKRLHGIIGHAYRAIGLMRGGDPQRHAEVGIRYSIGTPQGNIGVSGRIDEVRGVTADELRAGGPLPQAHIYDVKPTGGSALTETKMEVSATAAGLGTSNVAGLEYDQQAVISGGVGHEQAVSDAALQEKSITPVSNQELATHLGQLHSNVTGPAARAIVQEIRAQQAGGNAAYQMQPGEQHGGAFGQRLVRQAIGDLTARGVDLGSYGAARSQTAQQATPFAGGGIAGGPPTAMGGAQMGFGFGGGINGGTWETLHEASQYVKEFSEQIKEATKQTGEYSKGQIALLKDVDKWRSSLKTAGHQLDNELLQWESLKQARGESSPEAVNARRRYERDQATIQELERNPVFNAGSAEYAPISRAIDQARLQEDRQRYEAEAPRKGNLISRALNGGLGDMGWALFNVERWWRYTGGAVAKYADQYAQNQATVQEGMYNAGLIQPGFTGAPAEILRTQAATEEMGYQMGRAAGSAFNPYVQPAANAIANLPQRTLATGMIGSTILGGLGIAQVGASLLGKPGPFQGIGALGGWVGRQLGRTIGGAAVTGTAADMYPAITGGTSLGAILAGIAVPVGATAMAVEGAVNLQSDAERARQYVASGRGNAVENFLAGRVSQAGQGVQGLEQRLAEAPWYEKPARWTEMMKGKAEAGIGSNAIQWALNTFSGSYNEFAQNSPDQNAYEAMIERLAKRGNVPRSQITEAMATITSFTGRTPGSDDFVEAWARQTQTFGSGQSGSQQALAKIADFTGVMPNTEQAEQLMQAVVGMNGPQAEALAQIGGSIGPSLQAKGMDWRRILDTAQRYARMTQPAATTNTGITYGEYGGYTSSQAQAQAALDLGLVSFGGMPGTSGSLAYRESAMNFFKGGHPTLEEVNNIAGVYSNLSGAFRPEEAEALRKSGRLGNLLDAMRGGASDAETRYRSALLSGEAGWADLAGIAPGDKAKAFEAGITKDRYALENARRYQSAFAARRAARGGPLSLASMSQIMSLGTPEYAATQVSWETGQSSPLQAAGFAAGVGWQGAAPASVMEQANLMSYGQLAGNMYAGFAPSQSFIQNVAGYSGASNQQKQWVMQNWNSPYMWAHRQKAAGNWQAVSAGGGGWTAGTMEYTQQFGYQDTGFAAALERQDASGRMSHAMSVDNASRAVEMHKDFMGLTQELRTLNEGMIQQNRSYQQTQLNFARQRAGMQYRQGMESIELQEEQAQVQRRFQERELGINISQTLTRAQWQREDMAYQSNMAGLQYGWQQEDLSRNIRLATGRERMDLRRQRERSQIVYAMEESQRGRERERFETQVGWQMGGFERQKEQQKELNRLQDEGFAMQKRHLGENFQLTMAQLDAQQAHMNAMNALEDAKRKKENDWQDKEQKNQLKNLENQLAMAKQAQADFEAEIERRNTLFTKQKELYEEQMKYIDEGGTLRVGVTNFADFVLGELNRIKSEFSGGGGGGGGGKGPKPNGAGASFGEVRDGWTWTHDEESGENYWAGQGAIVTQPSSVKVGDNGPEAIIPLSQMPHLVPLSGGGGVAGAQQVTVTIQFKDGSGDILSAEVLNNPAFERRLGTVLRNQANRRI